MEATPYALPVRQTWWTDSLPELEKENRPHQISLLELQRHAPRDENEPQSCASKCAFTAAYQRQTNCTPLTQENQTTQIFSTSTSPADIPAPGTPPSKRKGSTWEPCSPASQRPMFATVYGNSPGNTPMPRSNSSVLRDLPIAPKKPVSPFNESSRPLDFTIGIPSYLQSCPGRAQDSARRHATGHAHQRVRVRRALDLQSSSADQGPQGREERSFAAASGQMRLQGSQSPDPRAARASALAGEPPRGAAGEQLSSLDETLDWWQGGGKSSYKGRRGLPPLSRKRSEPLPAARNMRPRCAAWNPTAAAAHTLARLQLKDEQ